MAVRRLLFAVMLLFSVADALDADLPSVVMAFRHASQDSSVSLIEPSQACDDDFDPAVAPVACPPIVVEPAYVLAVRPPARPAPPAAESPRVVVRRAPRSILGRAPPAA